MNTQSTVPFTAPTPSSVTNPTDIIDGSSKGAPSIPSHNIGANAMASNPAALTKPPPNSITTVSYATLPNSSTADHATHVSSDPGSVTAGIISRDSNANSMNSPVQDNVRSGPAAVDSNVLEEVGRNRSTKSMELVRKKTVRWGLPLEEVPFKLFDAESDEYQGIIYEASPRMTTPPFFEW